MAEDPDEEPLGFLVLDPGGGEQVFPIFDQIFVGRQCAGINERRRLVIDDPEISRNHLEVRLDTVHDHAFVIDTSTNGTLLNGERLDRAVPVPLRPGDRIRIGGIELAFTAKLFRASSDLGDDFTVARISHATMVMVVGDITNYSAIAQVTDSEVIARSLRTLWSDLGGVLRKHRGSLNHYAGDAIYAVWEMGSLPQANELAIDFALDANQRVEDLGPELPLRSPDGTPIHMGWGVVQGKAALTAMTRSVEAVIGDATNVAFRLAGLAGRGHRAAVMVTGPVRDSVPDKFRWGEPEQVEIKGRQGVETIYPVIARL